MSKKKRIVNRFSELLKAKERREHRTYTRRDLEQELGISITSIQNWMHNRSVQLYVTHWERIAEFLGLQDPGDLFIWEEHDNGDTESPENETAFALEF